MSWNLFAAGLLLFAVCLPSANRGRPSAPRADDTAGAAQDDPATAERKQITAAMKVLRTSDATIAQLDNAMTELLFLGIDGPKSLADWLEGDLKSRRKLAVRDEARILQQFELQASQIIAARQSPKTEREIDAARKLVLSHARNGNLTKETIQNESDPAVASLTKILTVAPQEVWEAVPKLREEWDNLLDQRDREFVLIETWQAARDALLSAPGGSERLAARADEPVIPSMNSKTLLDELDRRAELATPMSSNDRRVFEQNALWPVAAGKEVLEGEIDAQEKLGVRYLNRRRVLLGLPAQTIDLKLCNACRGHSRDMSEHDFFSHDSPLKGKETPWARAALAGTSASSENIARGADTGEGAILQWWYSPGHHRNMMGGGSRTGLGRFEQHWTQLFGG